MSQRYPLNPADYAYHALHAAMRGAGHCGFPLLVIAETSTRLDATRVRAALAALTAERPILRAAIRISPFSGWPHWHIDPAIDVPLRVEAVSGMPEAESAIERTFAADCDEKLPPAISLTLLQSDSSGWLVLRCPHALMDAGGGCLFMNELDRCSRPPSERGQPPCTSDDRSIDPLGRTSWLRRVRLACRGYRFYEQVETSTPRGPSAGPGRWRLAARRFIAKRWARIRERADAYCPDGPARFARYLAGCTLMALARISPETLAPLVISLPMRPRETPLRRPLAGNYIVGAILVGRREFLADKPRLMQDLARQTELFLQNDGVSASWALMQFAALLPESQYRRRLSPTRALVTYSSGFSYLDQNAPLTSLCGAPVGNISIVAPMSVPPGWNPVFTRYGESLTARLAFMEPHRTRAHADAYLDGIEAALLDEGA